MVESKPLSDDAPRIMVTDGGALNPAWAKDAVHPNLEGYHKMEEILLKSVKFK